MAALNNSIMKKISNPIVFFGSGPVAARSLELLHKDFEIEAVVTKPRLPHHNGDVPVLDYAEKYNLPIFTAQNKAELDTVFNNKPFVSKLGILIDFGIIVSQKVIDYFPLGIINSHFSLLPAWRGADPITFAILKGEERTGVSLMLLVEAMDEGPLLAQSIYELPKTITTPQLTEQLIDVSYALLREVTPLYIEGVLQPIPQASEGVSYSRRLSKKDSQLDWQKPAEELEREIRAFTGWPKSRANFGTLDVVITRAHVIDSRGEPGKTAIIDKKPAVFCGDKALILDQLKPANKKEMPGEAFLAGYKNQFLSS